MAEREPSELDLRAAFDAYLEDAPTQVRPAELAHGFATTYPIRHSALGRWGFGQTPAFAWVLMLAALLLALVVGGLVAGGWRLNQANLDTVPRKALHPTGIQMIYDPMETYDRVIVDGEGTYWAGGPGRLVRFDPETGASVNRTVADDATFGGSIVAPAANGGVWVGSTTAGYRRFDGTALRESIASPGGSMLSWEDVDRPWSVAPDGSFWQASWSGVRHWDGLAWVALPDSPGATAGPAFGRGGASDIWVPGLEPFGGVTFTLHFDGQRWMSAVVEELASLVTASDGTPWLATGSGRYQRFDGRAWVDVAGPGFAASSLAAGADGSIWALSEDVSHVVVARYDGTRWTTWSLAEGRVVTFLDEDPGGLSVTPAGVFVRTTRGLMHLRGDRWEPAWLDARPGPGSVAAFAPVSRDATPTAFSDLSIGAAFAPASRDEAWVHGNGTLWHYAAGRWESVQVPEGAVPAGTGVSSVAAGSDGTVWVGGIGGVAALVDGAWRVVASTGAGVDMVDANGTAWTLDWGGLIAVSRDPGVPVRRLTYTCETYDQFAPAPDGSVYLAAESGLYRVDDDTCARVDVLGNERSYTGNELLGGPAGRLLADINDTTMLFDGTRWTTIHEGERSQDSPLYAFDHDGTLWQLRRDVPGASPEWFDGARWVAIDGSHPWRALSAVDSELIDSIQITPDGALWFTAHFGIGCIPVGSP
jgi:hypothetical protein